ncbi:hypothetical protein PGT21_050294 [Puccinia graminis f. sp. tritici]|uniref:Uncharacterized protein n=1 Tax=Puccinia graminis f. sp. tritici TaxID=56615 RepID=A0A5B0MYH9_PUCGR|nr:hypothetical protein PGT21_050294 [Puccinia graminis f. sp. tritici]KAA1137048.1 hypothetical protein PGTUg99_050047 [Puccinia graminis f. sp. tritici]
MRPPANLQPTTTPNRHRHHPSEFEIVFIVSCYQSKLESIRNYHCPTQHDEYLLFEMVYVLYQRDVKFIVVRMVLRGLSQAEINETLGLNISPDSFRRWNELYRETRDVVRDPALYLDQGRPLALTRKEGRFVLEALEEEPTLYLDEIQSHIEALTGIRHPLSTLSDELKRRLGMTKKVARTVHPAQCPIRRAQYIVQIGPFPANYLVFLDECAVSV